MKFNRASHLFHPLLILGFRITSSTNLGAMLSLIPVFHGFNEVVYEYTSSAAKLTDWILKD